MKKSFCSISGQAKGHPTNVSAVELAIKVCWGGGNTIYYFFMMIDFH
jgi:hypothetical protein